MLTCASQAAVLYVSGTRNEPWRTVRTAYRGCAGPLLFKRWSDAHFRGVRGQRVLSTGMYAIALASQLCGETHIYGFGNGSCLRQCCAPPTRSPLCAPLA